MKRTVLAVVILAALAFGWWGLDQLIQYRKQASEQQQIIDRIDHEFSQKFPTLYEERKTAEQNKKSIESKSPPWIADCLVVYAVLVISTRWLWVLTFRGRNGRKKSDHSESHSLAHDHHH